MCAKPDWAHHGETIGRSSSKDRAEQLRFLWRRSLALEEANTCRDKRRELAPKMLHGSTLKFQTKHLRGFSLHTKRLLQKVQSSARQRSLIWILLGAQHLDLLAFILWAYVTYVPWYRLFTWRKAAQPLVLLVDVSRIGFKLCRLFKQICVFFHIRRLVKTVVKKVLRCIEFSIHSHSTAKLPMNPSWCEHEQ